MKRILTSIVAAALAAAAPAAAQTPTPTPTATPAALSDVDQLFMAAAAQSNNAEIAASQLAVQSASRGAVRSFAERMITDHTQVGTELSALAAQKGVTLPADTNAEQSLTLARLASLSGRAFDRAYVRNQTLAHHEAIDIFQTEADLGSDPDLKAFAQQQLPTLRQHLRAAQRLPGNTSLEGQGQQAGGQGQSQGKGNRGQGNRGGNRGGQGSQNQNGQNQNTGDQTGAQSDAGLAELFIPSNGCKDDQSVACTSEVV